MGIKTSFSIVLFVYAVNATILSNGSNVCSRLETFTKFEEKIFTHTKTKNYRGCCKRLVICVKKCTKSRIIRYRVTKLIAVPKLRRSYFCCKGWKENGEKSNKCSIPICNGGCTVGRCVRPNTCALEYDSTKGFNQSLLKERCGGEINSTQGVIKVGYERLSQGTQLCNYRINNPLLQPIKFNFERFQFNETVTCGRSSVTIYEDRKFKYSFCSLLKPTNEYLTVMSSKIVVEVIRSEWPAGNGITLRFEPLE